MLTDSNEPVKASFENECDYEEALEDYWGNDKHNEYEQYRQTVLEPYVNKQLEQHYISYALYSGCHFWNPTFGLTLAKLVCPTEEWELLISELHTTIVNTDRTKCFDVLFYEQDESFGGVKALSAATHNDK